MENLWISAHKFILDSQVGDHYTVGTDNIIVIKKTPKRVYFSNGNIVTIKKHPKGFYYLEGKRISQILRDIEGYYVYLKLTQ